MYIRRKVFSENKNREGGDVLLENVNSHRGLGRSVLIPVALGSGTPSVIASSALGGYVGKKYAEKLDREGKSEGEIVKGVGKRAALVGGAIGAGVGAYEAYKFKKELPKSYRKANQLLIKSIGDKDFKEVVMSPETQKITKGILRKSAKAAPVVFPVVVGTTAAIGARAGARKNTKTRLEKSRLRSNR